MNKKRKNTKKNQHSEVISQQAASEIFGLVIITACFMVFLSLISFAYGEDSVNWLGIVGNTIGWLFHLLFGITSYLIAAGIGYIGFRYLFLKPITTPRIDTFYLSLALLSICMLLSVMEDNFVGFKSTMDQLFYPKVFKSPSLYHLGGNPVYSIYHDLPVINLKRIFNSVGVTLIFSSTLFASILYFSNFSLAAFLLGMRTLISSSFEKLKAMLARAPSAVEDAPIPPKPAADFMRYVKLRMTDSTPSLPVSKESEDPNLLEIQPERELIHRPSVSRKTRDEGPKMVMDTPPPKPLSKREDAIRAQKVYNGDFKDYRYPSTNMLTSPKVIDQSSLKSGLRKQAEVLEETLASFGIEAKVGQINCGPTITSFEVHPAIGVKVQRILSLENDIALNMEAKSIRIIAPIPGKAAIGIEVPNPQPQEVSFKELMAAYQQRPKKFNIPILLGKAVAGEYVMTDLAKMPHCIIAGATGSGKSVCINTIIMSILFNSKPDEIQLLMVDPKKVELTPYSKLPHMIAPVITEPHGAYTALQWLVKEMEDRYEILKIVGVRNIDAFNSRKINKEHEESLNKEIPAKFPFIVGIVDELADLMMVSSSDIETPIARIAQMARAVGIHLILATQRPSREVITGLIKANFPTRIAFKVASRINSQIILDGVGAESLLGNGDFLFLPPGTSQLMRAQGAYIRDEDIHSVIDHICEQAPTNYRIPSFDKMLSLDGFLGEDDGGFKPADDMYHQAFEVVTSTGNASTTFLQRKLKIGYARAASLMDELEAQGVVSPQEGSKARRVLQTTTD